MLLSRATEVGVETVATEQARGRVAAVAVCAAHSAPHYRASAMDGIAVRAADTVEAGCGDAVVLSEYPGSTDPGPDTKPCCSIDTGGVLPEWADAVIRIEDTIVVAGGFSIRSAVAPGCDVRRAGEDIDQGARVVARGQRIRPYDIGALLAVGVYEIEVRRKPRVAIIATGSEIVEPVAGSAPAKAGEVIEYNSRVISASLHEWAAEPFYLGRTPDDQQALESIFRKAASEHDVVVIIAGSSVGRKDLTVEAIESCGELFVNGIDMMPGKPVALALIGNTPVLGLPGYPVSSVVAYEQLLGPLIAAMTGTAAPCREKVEARVVRKIPSRVGVEEFRRVCLVSGSEGYTVAPLARGAGSISSVAHAHGWLRIGAGREGVDAGSMAEIELIVPESSLPGYIVTATPPCELSNELEDELRRRRPDLALSYLDLSPRDALEALEAGQATLALFDT